ncbi:MAG: WcbI family polysaccharide biosynthesis putative acetyltransferase, partial [Desulfovibrionaceae bacterium]
ARHEVRLFTNYTREPVPAEALARCEVFLYQHLGGNWGELASAALLARLGPGAARLAVPPMFLKAYWPFWKSNASMDYPDGLVDQLLDKGLPPREVARIYLHTKVVAAHDLDAALALSIQRERAKERHADIRHVDELLARFRGSMLFNTVNHPGHGMLCWLGRRVLERLGLSEPPEGVEAAMPELHPEFRWPVHPAVGRHFGLEFAHAEARYPVYGRMLTHEEFIAEYILARSNNINEFIAFLRVRAGE